MKFKYFLRGLGTGILFASIICLVAFQNADSTNLSDKEVIERAKELGMVEKKESVKDMFNTEASSDNKEQTTEEVKKVSTKEESTKSKSSETTEKQTSEITTEEETTELTTEEKSTKVTTEQKTTEEKTTEITTEKVPNKNEKVTITIRGGMSSYPVCQMLQEAGVITDAADFDDYLIKNGYANRISVGTHILTIGMTYKEIAVAISDPE